MSERQSVRAHAPTPASPALAVVDRIGTLAGLMRLRGARVGMGEVLAAHRALAAVDAGLPGQARAALRATLCSRREDVAAFEAAWIDLFAARHEVPEPLRDAGRMVLPRAPTHAPPAPARRPSSVETEVVPAAWSDVELLRDRDFADYTDAERAAARRLLARLAARGATRPSRRTRSSRRRGHELDQRATLRSALRHRGELLDRRWSTPTRRSRPLVLILDVSGSMEPYARILMQYVHASVVARRRVEAFAFGTRLTRLTRELGRRDPDLALKRAAAAVTDWSGGTRIGESLAELNRVHGRQVGRGADVVILSDGWDRGDPGELAAEMARLARCAHRVVWLNPLKARAGYEPLARGMQAALPSVGAFRAGNSIRSLEEVAALLEDES